MNFARNYGLSMRLGYGDSHVKFTAGGTIEGKFGKAVTDAAQGTVEQIGKMAQGKEVNLTPWLCLVLLGGVSIARFSFGTFKKSAPYVLVGGLAALGLHKNGNLAITWSWR